MIQGYTDFNVDDEKKLLRDRVARTAKAVRALSSVQSSLKLSPTLEKKT